MYQADIYRKNNTCTSCVFNGFKYIYNFRRKDFVYLNLCGGKTQLKAYGRSLAYSTDQMIDLTSINDKLLEIIIVFFIRTQ